MAFQFQITLKDIKPLIWRNLILPAGFNFYQLHLAIQGAFGWENSHLFQFGKTRYSDHENIGIPDPMDETLVLEAKDVSLSSVFKRKGDGQIYVYDFGDDWQHEVILESARGKDPLMPVCTDGKNQCPPEDVGGTYGYEQMLEYFATGTKKEKQEYRVWLGLGPKEDWDPEYFSVRESNQRLGWIFAEY